MNAAPPRNVPAPPARKLDHGLTMAEMAAQEMARFRREKGSPDDIRKIVVAELQDREMTVDDILTRLRIKHGKTIRKHALYENLRNWGKAGLVKKCKRENTLIWSAA